MIDGITPPKRPEETEPKTKPKIARKVIEPLNNGPAFRPPENISDEEFALAAPVAERKSFDPPKKAKKGRFHIPLSWPPTRKQLLIGVPIALVVLSGTSFGAWKLFFDKPAPAPVAQKVEEKKAPEPAKPTTVASPLTGKQVQPDQAKIPILGVMIENSPDARPQAGLNKAGVVYEAIAEGGITRFLALYQEDQPDYIGPIRSARPYYVEWAQGYDTMFAHAGGSPEALALIRSSGVKDLDEFANSKPYQRVSSRYAPHNLYSNVAKLIDYGKGKGFTTSNFTGFVRKAEQPMSTPAATNIDVTMSGFLYNPNFAYDAATNSYKRSQAGKPHVDERSKEQISPKVVVVLVIPYGIQSDGIHSDYSTIGNGKAFIFQDGNVTEGIWEKASSKDPIKLGDANGSPLGINPGQTWISVVGTPGSVAYKP